MPNLAGYLEEHPDWKTAITAPDGNIYSLPSIDATAYTADSIPYVNKDWAAQVMQDLDLTLSGQNLLLQNLIWQNLQ